MSVGAPPSSLDSDEKQSEPSEKKAGHNLWGGRFSENTDQFVQAFTASVNFDKRLALADIQGSIAHASMLAKVGVLTIDEKNKIIEGLDQIRTEILSGTFQWSEALEDVHMNIEARLTERMGIVGKKLHTARSRNDQVATDIRLYVREEINQILSLLLKLKSGIVNKAHEYYDTILPGFTHLQNAQPITFGHHLLAWYEMLVRDYTRFLDCQKRLNQLPLGSAALAGTSYPIDRHFTAQLLGFDAVCRNSLDAVSDRDFAMEFTASASILMVHLSRMAEELILWTSSAFSFIDLPDRFCTGSSIMPQKKNPDVPELVRGKTGRVVGSLISLITLMKSQPLAYNKDNQEDKEPLFDTIDTVKNCVFAFSEMIPAMSAHAKNMELAALKGFTTATDLADYLVRKGVAFRDAHEIVGRTVQYAITHQLTLPEMSLETLQTMSKEIDSDIFGILTLKGSVESRNHFGATAPHQVLEQVEAAKKQIAEYQAKLIDCRIL